MNPKAYYFVPVILFTLLFASCGNNSVEAPTENSTVLYQKSGLVDSAYVTCCCTSVQRFFSDTLRLADYKKIKVSFNGSTNSDGSMIDLYYNTDTSTNTNVLTVRDQDSLNGSHSVEFNKPSDKITIEIRTTIFPPVCGTGECKYTRSRDFIIYGIR